MAKFNWKSKDDLLEDAKNDLNEELSNACKKAIISGFSCNLFGADYHFSYDKEDQTNILDTMRLFENNMITEITWNGRLNSINGEKVRMTLQKSHFYKLYDDSVKHKMSCISKYRDDLTELIKTATTIEEVQAINWNSITQSTFEANLMSENTIEKKVAELKTMTEQLEGTDSAVMMSIIEVYEMVMAQQMAQLGG